jgi:signal transduction histidine kinase
MNLLRKNGSIQTANIISDTIITSENEYLSKLKEMTDQNSRSVRTIEKLRKQLSESDSIHTKSFSIIAHDLRSPFHVILGSLELIRMKLADFHIDELENYIGMASDSATRTLQLLDDLLHWSLSQKAGKSFNPVKLNLLQVMEDEIGCLIFSADQKLLSINHLIAPDLNATADVQMVKTIVRNLISNAIKFTNPGGEITIYAAEGNKFIEIIVSDTGIGISPKEQKKLFKIETMHSTPGTNNERGSGFGLILCREFVEIHGGTLRVVSERGKGSKFIFTLPHYL